MSKQNTLVSDTVTGDKAAPLSEEQIDELIVAQADIDEAWDETIYVERLIDNFALGSQEVRDGKKNRARR